MSNESKRNKPAAHKPQQAPEAKKPPQNPSIPTDDMETLIRILMQARVILENHAAHLHSLDRRRLQSIGIKKEGFAQRAYSLAMENTEFLPNYLAPERFTEDHDHYKLVQTAIDIENQLHEFLKNIGSIGMNLYYTDCLDFYAAVREAAKRRVDAAETLHSDLFTFFRRRKSPDAPKTQKEQLRDAKGLINGTKDGKIVIENVKPVLTGGVHKVVDEQFNEDARYKETDGGDIKV